MRQYKLLLSQDFNWHDSGKGGEYIFGEDGYLKMDGSQGRIECSRYLKKPIKDKSFFFSFADLYASKIFTIQKITKKIIVNIIKVGLLLIDLTNFV